MQFELYAFLHISCSVLYNQRFVRYIKGEILCLGVLQERVAVCSCEMPLVGKQRQAEFPEPKSDSGRKNFWHKLESMHYSNYD